VVDCQFGRGFGILVGRLVYGRGGFSHPLTSRAARHDKTVALVERMLALHQKLAAAAISADKQLYQRQIEATDRQADRLVYELYGLTQEEIEIVVVFGFYPAPILGLLDAAVTTLLEGLP